LSLKNNQVFQDDARREAMMGHGGRRSRAGRKKGAPNKLTALAREGIERAAHALGGAERLAKWAKEDSVNERAFWTTIYTKLLPLQVTGENGGPIEHKHSMSMLLAEIDGKTRGLPSE